MLGGPESSGEAAREPGCEEPAQRTGLPGFREVSGAKGFGGFGLRVVSFAGESDGRKNQH